ncbi:hypothetical protein AVEN_198603-1 [Araneus ventricosus]|uniref:Uncharacterized protein n=1 Tax=Araneus ventricosus TaxID=182803 RepID=A0A4Y2S2H9_ARAVE|nr:hypothetical protein AVEN_198603-1 [Araneus ventricosus]
MARVRVPLIFQERVNCWWTHQQLRSDKDELFRVYVFCVRGCLLNRRVDKSHHRDVGREETSCLSSCAWRGWLDLSSRCMMGVNGQEPLTF